MYNEFAINTTKESDPVRQTGLIGAFRGTYRTKNESQSDRITTKLAPGNQGFMRFY